MSRKLIALQERTGNTPDPTRNALQMLKTIMAEFGRITDDDIRRVATEAHQPEAIVYGVANYYADLGLKPRGRTRVKVCKGTACFAACREASVEWFEESLGLKLGDTSPDGEVSLEPVYCLGFCNSGPAALVGREVYDGLTPERVGELCKGIRGNGGGTRLPTAEQTSHPPFAAFDVPAIVLERLVLGVDATRLEVACQHHAYEGLKKALAGMTAAQVMDEVCASELRGRGGAGFPTGTKWKFAAENAAKPECKAAYIVCNADEGDPGSYIDKYLMELDPHAVIEGIILAGYAIGATHGYAYVRSEYPLSTPILKRAVKDARAAGYLGKNILGSGWSFDIDIVEGAGAYVCGEETALLRSLEGLPGMVTARPPYPAVEGLFGMPTVVNNVETLSNIGWIVRHGGAAYQALGHNKSRGTKTVSLNERFNRPGVYEVAFGTPLRKILEEFGGGLKDGHRIKAVQVGGPLGGIIPEHQLDVPLGFEELGQIGALLGHGGIVAFDETTDMRDVAIHLYEFCDEESCGKCFPCRIGGRRGMEMVKRLKNGADRKSRDVIIALIEELCETMRLGSLCAHGGGIPAPIESILKHFRNELLEDSTTRRS